MFPGDIKKLCFKELCWTQACENPTGAKLEASRAGAGSGLECAVLGVWLCPQASLLDAVSKSLLSSTAVDVCGLWLGWSLCFAEGFCLVPVKWL